MEKIALNTMYKIKESSMHKCGTAGTYNALYLKFTKEDDDYFIYDLFTSADSTDRVSGCSGCYKPCDVEEIKQVTKKTKKNVVQKTAIATMSDIMKTGNKFIFNPIKVTSFAYDIESFASGSKEYYIIISDASPHEEAEVFATIKLFHNGALIFNDKQYLRASDLLLIWEEEVEKKNIKQLDISSVVMNDDKKEQIMATISQIKNHERIFNEWGFSDVIEKGTAVSLLFWGPPGTGKTMTAQAIAKTLGMEFKLIQTAEIETSEPGGAERNIKKIFSEAEEKNELLLLDECDSLISNRSKMGVILSAQVNALLTCLENFKGVVVFTTNRLGTLDPAFERRVSAKIEFEVPNKEQRKMIWHKMIPTKAPICKKIDWEKISEIEICGGNIKNAVLNAARYAAYKGMKKINQECFEKGLEKEVNGMIGFKQNESKQEVSQADFTRSRGLISTQL